MSTSTFSRSAATLQDLGSTPSAGPIGRFDARPLLISLVVVSAAVVLWLLASVAGVRLSVWLTPRPLPNFHTRLAAFPAGPLLEKQLAARGHDVFESTCSACHASTGLGKQGLGKDLVHSDFIADRSDAELVDFITRGRDASDPLNTTKVPMPPKGGNAALEQADLAGVVVYIRGLQDPRRMPELPALTPIAVKPPTEAEKAAVLAAAGGDAELAGYIASGTKLFATTCATCHGRDAKGLKSLGKDLVTSEFLSKTDDDGLLAFVKRGRGPSEPGNTTGVAMPPKGGNPALSDDDILDIITFLRTLQPKASPANKAGN